MLWSSYFEYVALAILCVQFVFYRAQRFLPRVSNVIFSRTLYIEIFTVCLDIIASVTSSHVSLYPLGLLYLFNEAYFFCLFLFINELAKYCRTFAESRARVRIRSGMLYRIPVIVAGIIAFTTHWTGFLFHIDPVKGYARGTIYYPLFSVYLIFYFCFIVYYLVRYRTYIPADQKRGLFICLVSVYIGFVIQVYFLPYVLLINIFSSLGLLVLCLSLQNPSHDQDDRSGLYNIASFSAYTDELARQGTRYACVGFTFASYYTFLSESGGDAKKRFLSGIGKLLTTRYADYPAFYFHKGQIVLMAVKGQETERLLEDLRRDLPEWWAQGGTRLDPELRFVLLSSDTIEDPDIDVTGCLRIAFDEMSEGDSQEVLTVGEDLIRRLNDYRSARRLLARAVHENAVEVWYQPIYDTAEGRIVSAEALARIHDGQGGIIFPDIFIPIAEKEGLILQLGMQVFEKVCVFISTHDMQALGLRSINVNLSPIQCLHKSLADDLLETARRHHVDMHRVTFEITESSMMDIDSFHDIMQRLIEAGASFSLDDYGTGFSNLINVLSLPFGTLKIDKSIAWAYFQGNDQVLPEIVRMFRDKQLNILVEGVETRRMAEELAEMKCQYEQGYYFSRPVPEEKFLRLLAERLQSSSAAGRGE